MYVYIYKLILVIVSRYLRTELSYYTWHLPATENFAGCIDQACKSQEINQPMIFVLNNLKSCHYPVRQLRFT
jgi:hypothetical protein